MLFLVTGQVTTTQYMGSSKTKDVLRLVEAVDFDDARDKFEKYYADQTSEYSHYVHASAGEVSGVIT